MMPLSWKSRFKRLSGHPAAGRELGQNERYAAAGGCKQLIRASREVRESRRKYNGASASGCHRRTCGTLDLSDLMLVQSEAWS